jgi:hypothetical protein
MAVLISATLIRIALEYGAYNWNLVSKGPVLKRPRFFALEG